jgi:hypothetical protein
MGVQSRFVGKSYRESQDRRNGDKMGTDGKRCGVARLKNEGILTSPMSTNLLYLSRQSIHFTSVACLKFRLCHKQELKTSLVPWIY